MVDCDFFGRAHNLASPDLFKFLFGRLRPFLKKLVNSFLFLFKFLFGRLRLANVSHSQPFHIRLNSSLVDCDFDDEIKRTSDTNLFKFLFGRLRPLTTKGEAIYQSEFKFLFGRLRPDIETNDDCLLNFVV